MAREKNPIIEKLRSVPVSAPYASQIVSGARAPSLKLALKIFRKTGLKFGPIKNASARAIREFEQPVSA